MVTTSIVFDHRGRIEKGKEGPVEIRVTVDRKAYYINTGVRVTRAQFKYGMIINRADSPELNERVRLIAKKVDEEINRLIADGLSIDVADIRRKVMCGGSSSRGFIEWAEVEIESRVIGSGAKKHYRTSLAVLIKFGRIMDWGDLTVENIIEYDKYLHSMRKPLTQAQELMGIEAEKLSDGTIYNYHKCLKSLINTAINVDRMTVNPYARLKGKFSRGEKETVEYLTEYEIDAIRNLELPAGSHICMVRDMFIFQMFTGMAFSDMENFDISNYKQVNGEWRTINDRIKTGVAYVSVLLPPVVHVLERYGWHIPKMSNQKYNETLKEIGKLAGITTPLHSHLARHTFATYMLSNGVPLENVQRMLGHAKLEMTRRYAKTLASSVNASFDMIAEKLKSTDTI